MIRDNGYLEELPLCKTCPIRAHRRLLRERGVKFDEEYLKEYAAVSARYIQGDKSLPAVLFVGEAPGDSEERSKAPFVGVAGKLLRKVINDVLSSQEIIEKAGRVINFEMEYKTVPVHIYFSNACKCRPVGEDGKFRTPRVEEIKHCNPRLLDDIREIKPCIIVALGKSAAIALNVPEANKTKFEELRGKVFPVWFNSIGKTIPVFVTYHPSKITRSKMKLAKVYYDDFENIFNLYLQLLEEKKEVEVRGGSLDDNLKVLCTTKEVVSFLEEILRKKPNFISIDYETSPVPWDLIPVEVRDFYRSSLDVYSPLSHICFVSIATDGSQSVSFPLYEKEVLAKHLEKAKELEDFYVRNKANIIKDCEAAFEEYTKTGAAYVVLYGFSQKYGFTGPINKDVQKSIIHLIAERFENSDGNFSHVRGYLVRKIDELVSKIRRYKRVLEDAIEEYERTFDVDPEEVRPLLIKVLASQRPYKVIMNPVFEKKFSLVKLCVDIKYFVGIDLLDHLLGALQPSLEDLIKRYLPDIAASKRDFLQASLNSTSVLKGFAYYNAFDALVTYRIFEKEKEEIEKISGVKVYDFKKERLLSDCIYQAHRFYREVVVPLVTDVELSGMKYDVEKSLKLALELREKARRLERMGFELLQTYVPGIDVERVRLRKKEGKEVLYKAYEKEPILTDKGELSISVDALKQIYETTIRENVKKAVLCFYSVQKLEKIISTYLEKYPYYVSPYTGRIHSSYQITKTATGRLASAGPNIQQVPREGIRSCPNCDVFPLSEKESVCPICVEPFEESVFLKELFISEDGNVLIVADYSQMEVRLLAELAKDEKLLSAIEQGLDMHSYNASSAFNIPYDVIYANKDTDPEMKRLRQLAKKITFAIVYGSTPEGIAETVGILVDEAKRMIENFLKNHPRVVEYIDFCHTHAGEKKCVVTPIGRVRWFVHSSLDEETRKAREASVRREAQNMPIQSISSDINLVAAELMRRRNQGVKVIGLVHDSIILETSEGDVDKVCEELRKVMEEEVKSFLKERFDLDLVVKLKADIGRGRNWKEASP